MSTINKNIKELRKFLNITQQEFADRIGSKRNTVAKYETAANTPSAAVISLICREFNVNETWLRTGEGDIYNLSSDDNVEDDNMGMVNFTICMDEILKKQAETLFSELGMDINTAFTIFAKTAIRQQKIPFEISLEAPHSEIINKDTELTSAEIV
jgi:addiction module RelB/DinJ family antitoxin